MSQFRRSQLIDHYLDALRADLNADPPPGLDTKTAELLRALVLAKRADHPPTDRAEQRARVWARALQAAELQKSKSTSTGWPPFSENDRSVNRGVKFRIEDAPDAHISPRLPLHRRQNRAQPLATLVAALLSITFMAALMSVMSQRAQKQTAAARLSEQETTNATAVTRFIEDVWNDGNRIVLDQVVAPDFRFEPILASGLPSPSLDRQQFLDFLVYFHNTLPDTYLSVQHVSVEGDSVHITVNAVGTEYILSDRRVIIADVPFALTMDFWAELRDGKIYLMRGRLDTVRFMYAAIDGRILALSQQAETQTNLRIAERLVNHIWNNSSVAVETIGSFYAPDVIWHPPNALETLTLPFDQWRDNVLWTQLNMFSSLQVTIDHMAADGDTVMVHYTASAILQNNGLSPNGAYVTADGYPYIWEGIFIFRFENYKVVEEWWYWDNALMASAEYSD